MKIDFSQEMRVTPVKYLSDDGVAETLCCLPLPQSAIVMLYDGYPYKVALIRKPNPDLKPSADVEVFEMLIEMATYINPKTRKEERHAVMRDLPLARLIKDGDLILW